MAEARVLIKFAAEIYQMQFDGRRHFLHEDPVGAFSWEELAMVQLCQDKRVGSVVWDQHVCEKQGSGRSSRWDQYQHGLQTKLPRAGQLSAQNGT